MSETAVRAQPPGRLQTKSSTSADRYPLTFAAAAQMTQAASPRRILSFGCSLGLECATLHDLYFTRADDEIVGVDIKAKAIRGARERNPRPRVRYTQSDDPGFAYDPLPFDVIFAMAVFAVTGSDEMDDISAEMPFSTFADACAFLDSRLKPGGLLVIANSNYRFTDLPLAAGYDAHPDPNGRANGNLRLFDPSGKVAASQDYPFTLFVKRAAP